MYNNFLQSFTVTAIDGDRYINADIIYFLLASDDGGDYCNGSNNLLQNN